MSSYNRRKRSYSYSARKYVIVGTHDESGKIYGFVDSKLERHSEYVKVFDYSSYTNQQLYNKAKEWCVYANSLSVPITFKVYRLNSKHCPITVQYGYRRRNCKFKLK